MSKFLKVMIALVVIAGLAAPAIAEDRLGLGGQMRVRAWSLDNGTDTSTFVDQRLRIGGKLSIAEGVSVTFRFDETERTWGDGGNEFGSGRLPQDGMQWDRAHFDLDMGNVHLRAGQQWLGYGLLGGTVNAQEGGLKVDVKGPVAISAFWMLDDQRGGTSTADSYLFGAQVGHKTDAYAGNVFLAGQTKAKDAAESVYLLGANAKFNLNAVKLAAELDFFFGDANATDDAVGTQLFVDASMAASDTVTVGGQVYYALSADAGEVQYQNLGNDFGGWDPIMESVASDIQNEKMAYGRPFDFAGGNSGVIGLRAYGAFKFSDALNLGASVAYLTPEDDANTTRDSDLLLVGSASYKVMANTTLQAQIQSVTKDDSDNTVEDELQLGLGLFVNF